MKLGIVFYVHRSNAGSTVQPEGIPFVPVFAYQAASVPAALLNVPVVATPYTQSLVQLSAEISVARQVMELRLEQP